MIVRDGEYVKIYTLEYNKSVNYSIHLNKIKIEKFGYKYRLSNYLLITDGDNISHKQYFINSWKPNIIEDIVPKIELARTSFQSEHQ